MPPDMAMEIMHFLRKDVKNNKKKAKNHRVMAKVIFLLPCYRLLLIGYMVLNVIKITFFLY